MSPKTNPMPAKPSNFKIVGLKFLHGSAVGLLVILPASLIMGVLHVTLPVSCRPTTLHLLTTTGQLAAAYALTYTLIALVNTVIVLRQLCITGQSPEGSSHD